MRAIVLSLAAGALLTAFGLLVADWIAAGCRCQPTTDCRPVAR